MISEGQGTDKSLQGRVHICLIYSPISRCRHREVMENQHAVCGNSGNEEFQGIFHRIVQIHVQVNQ